MLVSICTKGVSGVYLPLAVFCMLAYQLWRSLVASILFGFMEWNFLLLLTYTLVIPRCFCVNNLNIKL